MSYKEKKTLKPLTFKITQFMLNLMDEMIEEGEYSSRADLIRTAIQKLIDLELTIPRINHMND